MTIRWRHTVTMAALAAMVVDHPMFTVATAPTFTASAAITIAGLHGGPMPDETSAPFLLPAPSRDRSIARHGKHHSHCDCIQCSDSV